MGLGGLRGLRRAAREALLRSVRCDVTSLRAPGLPAAALPKK